LRASPVVGSGAIYTNRVLADMLIPQQYTLRSSPLDVQWRHQKFCIS